MTRSVGRLRVALLGLGLLALAGAIALPALAASPSAAPGGDGGTKGPKASKAPEVAVTLHGAVVATKDADGGTTYTMTVDGKTVRLDAGPPWFFGDAYPLAPFVGKTVTITGTQSGDQVDVETVDGQRLRGEGRPPWAGGPKAVGSAHPGWSQEKADRWAQKAAAKGSGASAGAGCWPPGHCRDHAPEPEPSDESPATRGG